MKKQSPILKSKQNNIEKILIYYKEESIERIHHMKQTLGLYVFPLLLNEKIEHFVTVVKFLF